MGGARQRGSPIWSNNLGNGAFNDPVAAGNVICFAGNDDNTWAVRATDGTRIWATGAGGGMKSDTVPASAEGVIYFSGADHKLYAVRASDGAPIWASGLGGTVTDPAPAGGVIYFGGADNKLYAVRASDGSLIWASSLGWGRPQIVAALAGGLVLAAAFVAAELRAADPMVPLRLFRSRPIAAGNAAAFCVFAMLLALVFFMAQFLQTALGYDPLGTGLRLLPGWATLTLIAPFAGRLIARVGERPLITGGLTAAAAGLTWIALIARAGLPYEDMVAPLVIAGSGASVAIPATMSAVMTTVPPKAIGQASGTLNMLRQLGGVFGIAICAAVFATRGGYASPAAFTSGFGPAMGACAGLALLGAVAGLIIPASRQSAPVTPAQPRSQPLEIRR